MYIACITAAHLIGKIREDICVLALIIIFCAYIIHA